MTRSSLLLFLALIALSCDSDTPTAPSGSDCQLLRDEHHERHGQSRRSHRRGLAMSIAGAGRGSWQSYVASLPQRGARSGQRQPTDTREGSHWLGALVQHQSRARRQQRDRVAQPHGRCGALSGRARAAYQRPVDGFARASRARHPHRIQRRRDPRCRTHVRGLDVRLTERSGAGWPLRRDGPQPEHRRSIVVVELGAHESELCEHGAARGCRSPLLLRSISLHSHVAYSCL